MKRKIAIYSVICFTVFANAASGMNPDTGDKFQKHKSVSETTKKRTNNTPRQRLAVQPIRQFVRTDAMHFMPQCKSKKPAFIFQNTSSAEPNIFKCEGKKPVLIFPNRSSAESSIFRFDNINFRSLTKNEESTDANERPKNVTGLKGKDYQDFLRLARSIEAEKLRGSSSKQKTNSSHEFNSEEKSSTAPQKSSVAKENQQ